MAVSKNMGKGMAVSKNIAVSKNMGKGMAVSKNSLVAWLSRIGPRIGPWGKAWLSRIGPADTDQSYLSADALDADNETPMNHLLGS